MGNRKLKEIAKGGVLAALYVVLTMLIAPLAYGPFQIRISEMFNHMIDFNKRYIWALTLGCFISNLQSPLGPVDTIIGTIGTLLTGVLIYAINKNIHSLKKKLVVSTLVPSFIGMLPVAMELYYLQHVPFWATYASTVVGELISLLIGVFLVLALSKRMDLTK
jgi:uncharacterized membrane protein